MARIPWLMVFVAGLLLFGCDSPEQPKPQAAPVAQQPVAPEKATKTEQAETAVPAAEPPQAMADKAQEKSEQPTATVPSAAKDTAKDAPSVAVEAGAGAQVPASDAAKQVNSAKTAAADTATATVDKTAKAAVPQELTLPASNGNVTFPHGKHADSYACNTCHGDAVPEAFGITKDIAHKLCKDCHKNAGAGPTACGGCHKK